MGRPSAKCPSATANRERGTSHYGISRTFRVFFDLITIRFLLRYLSRPLHFFGTLGMASIFGGSAIVAWLGVEKFLRHMPVMASHGPLMMAALGLLLGGLNLLAIGLLGEMQVRHYHEPAAARTILDRPCAALAKRRTQRIGIRFLRVT